MAVGRISSFKSPEKSQSITTALASAVLEWLLICLLLIDAIFSYLIMKFAHHCQLQTPCLLCSRLDHILGKKNNKLKQYRNLICGNHKLEISSLVLCRAHDNLVDVHGMCESCLFSFATINKSNSETYRLLVGKLGEDSSIGLDQDPLLVNHISSPRRCSCCNEPCIQRGGGQKLMQIKSVGSEAADIDFPLSGAVRYDWESLTTNEQSVLIRPTQQRNSWPDPLSHVRYTELNIDSETESEALFPGDDEANALIHETNVKEDAAVGCLQPDPPIISLPDDSASENLIDPASATEPSGLVPQLQSDVIKSNGVATVAIGHGLEELTWQQADCKPNLSSRTELLSIKEVSLATIAIETPDEASTESNLVSLDNAPSSSDARETPEEASKETKLVSIDDNLPSSDASGIPVEISKEIKLISLVDVLPSANEVDTPVEGLKQSCDERPEEIWRTLVTDSAEICKAESRPGTTTETASEINSVSGENGLQGPNSLDLGEAYKLAVGNRGRQFSGVLSEQWVGKDSSRISEDLKLLLSQLSAARELTDMSPRVPMSPRIPISPKVSTNSDELKTSDASSIKGMQILQKRVSLERNESGQSLDGSIVSEIEGESVVDRLKRQIEHDKKLLTALYKELEEERNASAIAANQAMAMITRLQEEKATLHMEALQCLRMMEEQAEYDMEALQKTNDLLAEKEKEVQDLEAELELYRDKFPNESMLEDPVESVSGMKAADIRVDFTEAASVNL